MRAGRKGGSRGEFRPALHILRFFRLFRTILHFARNCGSFYLKFELILPKILKIKEVRRHGRRGVGRNAVPPSYCFLFFRHALVELGRCGTLVWGELFPHVIVGFIFTKKLNCRNSKRPTSASMESVAYSSSVRTANRRTDFLRIRTIFSEKKRKSTASRQSCGSFPPFEPQAYSNARIDIWHRVMNPRVQGGLALLALLNIG